MDKLLIIVLGFVLISCNSSVKENVSQLDSSKTKTIDSLRDPNATYYLFDINPKQFGELILKDSIQPSDNMSTFRVMDSINAKSLKDRKFFIKVYEKIMYKADGALAEAVGSPAWKYTEEHTIEFMEYSKNLSKEDLMRWSSFIGYEIGANMSTMGETIQEDYFGKYQKKMISNCSECSKEMKENLKQFLDSVFISVNEMMK
jgi:hypothetical protein